MSLSTRALGPPALPAQAPQSSAAPNGLFAVVLRCPHSSTSAEKPEVMHIVVSAPYAIAICSASESPDDPSSSERSSAMRVDIVGSTSCRTAARSPAVRCGAKVLSAASGPSTHPAASANAKGAAAAVLAS